MSLFLLTEGCGGPRPAPYFGVATIPPPRIGSATLKWVVSRSQATGTLTIDHPNPPIPDLPAGSYPINAVVSGAGTSESFRGSLTSGGTAIVVAGAGAPDASYLVLQLLLPGGKISLDLHLDVPGTYSGTVVGSSTPSTLSWQRTGATATGHLTVGAHRRGAFSLAAGSYPATFQFTDNVLEGTIHDGSRSFAVHGSVLPEEVVVTVALPDGPVTITFHSVGQQSYTGYGG